VEVIDDLLTEHESWGVGSPEPTNASNEAVNELAEALESETKRADGAEAALQASRDEFKALQARYRELGRQFEQARFDGQQRAWNRGYLAALRERARAEDEATRAEGVWATHPMVLRKLEVAIPAALLPEARDFLKPAQRGAAPPSMESFPPQQLSGPFAPSLPLPAQQFVGQPLPGPPVAGPSHFGPPAADFSFLGPLPQRRVHFEDRPHLIDNRPPRPNAFFIEQRQSKKFRAE
jgi:hypothetical protein